MKYVHNSIRTQERGKERPSYAIPLLNQHNRNTAVIYELSRSIPSAKNVLQRREDHPATYAQLSDDCPQSVESIGFGVSYESTTLQ
jgi:hypothetical protein